MIIEVQQNHTCVAQRTHFDGCLTISRPRVNNNIDYMSSLFKSFTIRDMHKYSKDDLITYQ